MGNYRTATILSEKTLSGAGTETIDILVKDIISRILMTWKIDASKHGMDSYPHRDITKIELVDGSDVLFSMNGGQCQALNIYDRKCPTMNYGKHYLGGDQRSNYAIDFGRFLYDPELAFDPAKFRNAVLKITYDSDVADTGVTEGTLQIRAEVFDEKVVSPVGFLMSKEHHSRTPPASGYWYVDLPLDHPFRKLLIQGYNSALEPWEQVSEARIDEDNEKRILFDWELDNYYRVMQARWTPVEEQIIGVTDAAGNNYYVTPTDYWSLVALSPRAAASYMYATPIRGGMLNIGGSIDGQNPFMGIVRGYLPNHCFEFPFGLQEDMADWYDVTRLGSVRLRMEAGGGGVAGTVAVILQQLRRY